MMTFLITVSFYLLGFNTPRQANSTTTTVPAVAPSAVVLRELTVEGNMIIVFTTVIRDQGLSGGIVYKDQGCSYGQKRTFSINAGTTLQQALDHLAQTGEHFQWNITEGVVNMMPDGEIPPLLLMPVNTFTWDKTATARESIGRLLSLSGLKEKAAQLGLKPGIAEGGASAVCIRNCSKEVKPEPILQVESNTKLISILDRIVSAHPGTVWAYSEHHCKDETNFGLYLVTE